MDIEKTMEFILESQAKSEQRWAKAEERWAKAEERWAKADRRMDRLEALAERLIRSGEFLLENQAKAEGRLDRMEHLVGQNNRLVTRLAHAGVALRSDVRRHERAITRIAENLAEATDKLNALIDVVDKWPRRNGGAR